MTVYLESDFVSVSELSVRHATWVLSGCLTSSTINGYIEPPLCIPKIKKGFYLEDVSERISHIGRASLF